MAFGKKYVKKTTIKKVYKKRPAMGKGVSAQVARLTRQVARLSAVAIQKIQYRQLTLANLNSALGLDSYVATPLMKYSNWARVFGNDADNEAGNKAVIRSMSIPWRFQTNEPDNRQYTIFVVSLKDNASDLLNSTTSLGDLNTLVQDTHYSSSADRTLLNLKYFNVHYQKKFTAGVYPMNKNAVGTAGAVQNIPEGGIDTQRLGKINLKFGKNGIRVSNPAGDWKANGYPRDPSQNYYILTFWSGDSSADSEWGSIQYDALTAVEVSA